MFRRVLIANRGEIAIRIVRACREEGIESVAVYSEADRESPHVRAADRAVLIGPAPSSESYLSTTALIAAARATSCDALHPGYGFLSENPALARACEQEGVAFIGPPAAIIERMGSKIAARETAQRAGVPAVRAAERVRQRDRTGADTDRRVAARARQRARSQPPRLRGMHVRQRRRFRGR